MAFTDFRTLADVLKFHQIRYEKANFEILNNLLAPEVLRDDIEFTLREVPYNASEAAIGENLIYPVLKSAWRPFSDALALWSHQAIREDNGLSGIPDYLIAKRSEQGIIFLETPFVAVVEAKRDDFSGGWAQCGLEMATIQKINHSQEIGVCGIVSNGRVWEFAILRQNIFTSFNETYDIAELDELYSALASVMEFCKQQLLKITQSI